MTESNTKLGRKEKAGRMEETEKTLAEIQRSLPPLYDFFMDLEIFIKKMDRHLQSRKKKQEKDDQEATLLDDMEKELELLNVMQQNNLPIDIKLLRNNRWTRYCCMICSKLGAEKRQAFLDELDALPPELRAEHLRQTRSSWISGILFQALSDEKRRLKNSSANVYHRMQLLIRKYRPEHLYLQGNWYGRPGMEKDSVLLFEKHLDKHFATQSFIASLPVVPGLELQHFYNKSGDKFRFEGFGRALDAVLKSVQEKSGSPDTAFFLHHFMCWFTRCYPVTARTVSDDDGTGSLIDRLQASNSDDEKKISPHDLQKVFLLLKKKLDAPYLRLLELKVYGKTARQIMEDMKNAPFPLNNDSAVNYHYKKIQAVTNECFAELDLPTGKKAFKEFLALFRSLYSIHRSGDRG